MNQKEYKKIIDELQLLDQLKLKEADNLRKCINRIDRKHQIILYSISGVACLLVLSFLLWVNNSENSMSDNGLKSGIIGHINHPTLILGSGEEIELNDHLSELISIEKRSKNNNSLKLKDVKEEKYNTVIIPSRFTHNIILEDGTEVFLNAGSELKYPTTFNLQSREVYLKGEAYFKVTKSEREFIVHTSDMDIRVYGTEFNINTNHKNFIETILVKGSIGAYFNDNELKMNPNELLVFNVVTKDKIVGTIPVSDYLGWMSGDFVCNAQPLSKLLDDISAWFGVTFKENKQLNNYIINVNISRDLELDKLLKTIEEMSGFTFIKERRSLYIVK